MSIVEKRYWGLRGPDGPYVVGPDGRELARRETFDWSVDGEPRRAVAMAIVSDHVGRMPGMGPAAVEKIAATMHVGFADRVVTSLSAQWSMSPKAIDEFAAMWWRGRCGQDVDWSLWGFSVRERGLVKEVTNSCRRV